MFLKGLMHFHFLFCTSAVATNKPRAQAACWQKEEGRHVEESFSSCPPERLSIAHELQELWGLEEPPAEPTFN